MSQLEFSLMFCSVAAQTQPQGRTEQPGCFLKEQVRGRPGEVSSPRSHSPLDFGPSHSVLTRSAGSADEPVHQEDNKHHLPVAGKEKRLLVSFPGCSKDGASLGELHCSTLSLWRSCSRNTQQGENDVSRTQQFNQKKILLLI